MTSGRIMKGTRVLAWLLPALLLACGFHSAAQAGRIEAGFFTAHDTFNDDDPRTVSFQQPFDTPPIVIVLPSQNGSNSASIKITNVTTTGFDELILEPDNWDGPHLSMNVPYIAVEPGRHVLPDGTVIEAGFTDLTNVQFGNGFSGGVRNWANVSFSRALSQPPMILHQLQTANSETRNVANQSSRPHVTSIAQSPTLTGFQLAIERSQANSGPFPSSERIGWVAFPNASTGSFADIAGNAIAWSASTSPATIRGWDNGCFNQPHGLTGGSPVVIAKKTTRNNQDGGWLRYCSINGANISLRVDEDRDQDNERSISTGDAESAAIVAFSRSFHANFTADLSVTKVSVSTDDGNGGAFKTPGAIVTYLITVSNSGNSPPNEDSVLITEQLPGELDLLVTDLAGSGSGPVVFADGTPATGLTCGFVALGVANDCIAFSADGSDYGYAPSNSGNGTDPAVRFVRINPSGFMSGNDGTGPSRFTLRLRARINTD
ncbi:MAG: H-type lectin domain-containing protein [Pseudomonadota bacterium]